MAASQDMGELLSELANKIERLKTLYEQYFMGIEKMEPQVARKEVTRVMLALQQQYIRNTALRFRFNTMLQKWNIYITYWNRCLREIENGTYVRHLQKAKRKAEAEGRDLPSEMLSKKLRPGSGTFDTRAETQRPPRLDDDTGSHAIPPPPKTDPELEQVFDRAFSDDILPSTKPPVTARPPTPPPPFAKPLAPPLPPPLPPGAGRDKSPLPVARDKSPLPVARDKSPLPVARPPTPPPPPMAARPPTPPPPGPPPGGGMLPKIPGMSDGELRALHQRYVDAQKKSGAASTVKYETLVSSLAKQVPTVLKQPGVKGVRFDVSVQDGKPVLKAFPQK
jgi:hypothetical protein